MTMMTEGLFPQPTLKGRRHYPDQSKNVSILILTDVNVTIFIICETLIVLQRIPLLLLRVLVKKAAL